MNPSRSSIYCMPTGSYYVYALKDPRTEPARIFYVGKGTGSRASDHLARPDGTRKGRYINAIRKSGHEPRVVTLVASLSEVDALRIEAELISAFGTIESGGLLSNSVIPHGTAEMRRRVSIPEGVIEIAQLGLQLLEQAVERLALENPAGISNADAADALGLRSDHRGSQKDYLTYSVIGLLLRKGRLVRTTRPTRYRSTQH
jgi:hypothetical protein